MLTNTVLKCFVVFLALCFIAPNASANLLYEGEYEEKTDVLDIGTEATTKYDLFDLEGVNNWNNTILPLMDEREALRGIAQYNPTFPEIVSISQRPIPAASYTTSLAWQFSLDENVVFDTAVDSWLRLPVNNLSLGNTVGDTYDITVYVYQLYISSYNISLALSPDTTITDGPHGDTPFSLVWTQRVFNASNLLEVPINYSFTDNRVVNWSSNTKTGVENTSLEYNFTYARLTCPFAKGIPYIIRVDYKTWINGTDKPLEILLSHGDSNNDRFFMSHVYYNSTQFDIPFDFDAPMIFTDLASEITSGVGFVSVGNSTMTYYSVYDLDDIDVTFMDAVQIMLPIFALENVSVEVRVSLYLIGTGWRDTGLFFPTDTVDLNGGFNTILSLTEVATAGSHISNALRVVVNCSRENASLISFPTEVLEGQNAYQVITENSHTDGPVLFNSSLPFVIAYMINTTAVMFVPLEQYAVFVVPDPSDYEASLLYVNYSQQFAHAIQDSRLWIEDEEGDIIEVIITLTIIGLLVVGVAAYIAGAPVLVPLTAVAIAIAWLYREQLKRGLHATYNAIKGWVADNLAPIFYSFLEVLYDLGAFIYRAIVFVVHAISWLITHALHFMALWTVLSVYLLCVFAANGICSACTAGRRKRKRGYIINFKVFDDVISSTWDRYWKLLTMNFSLYAALMGFLAVILRMVSPI